MIRSISIKFNGLWFTYVIYITLSTSAAHGIPFCQVLDSEIRNFENLFLLENLSLECVYSEEWVLFGIVLCW